MSRAFLFILVLVSSLPALAQTSYSLEHHEWEASVFAGYNFASTLQFPTLVSGSTQEASRTVGMRYAPGYLLGARVNQNLGDFWGVDIEYTFSDQNLEFTNISPAIQHLSLNQYIHNLSYNVSYLPLPRTKRFRPYADAGIGASLFYIARSSKNEALDLGLKVRDSWEFLGNVGGGFKFLMTDQLAVTVDLKDRISRVPSYGIPTSAQVIGGQYHPGMSLHGLLHSWKFNAGITYQWDEW
jgi:opacity protein-like surface antigen